MPDGRVLIAPQLREVDLILSRQRAQMLQRVELIGIIDVVDVLFLGKDHIVVIDGPERAAGDDERGQQRPQPTRGLA